jgi:light-independent protochlorophyllide reductase subunit B
MGTFSREFAREVREAAKSYGLEALITDDYLQVEEQIRALQPELILGTQMERHIAKRLGIPCAVISAPVHVQDFPARYSPQMGFEGANVLFDTWVHPLMMGLEEHLLGMFRGDFEFHEGAAPSHLGATRPSASESGPAADRQVAQLPSVAAPTDAAAANGNATATQVASASPAAAAPAAAPAQWSAAAEKELGKIPFFVRGKARRNTERFAQETGVATITVETLYDAKAHFSR